MTIALTTSNPYGMASAWMLILAALIILIMILGRSFDSIGNGLKSLPKIGSSIMGENSKGHTIIYGLIFALVLASAMYFFVN